MKMETQIIIKPKHHDVYYFKDQYGHDVHFELEDAIDLSHPIEIEGDTYTSVIKIEYNEVQEVYLLFANFDKEGNIESVTLMFPNHSTIDKK